MRCKVAASDAARWWKVVRVCVIWISKDNRIQRQIEWAWRRKQMFIKTRGHRGRVRTDVPCTHVLCVCCRNAMYDEETMVKVIVWFRYIEIRIVGACVLQSCNCRMLKKAFAAASMCSLHNVPNVLLNAWDQLRHIRTWSVWRSLHV